MRFLRIALFLSTWLFLASSPAWAIVLDNAQKQRLAGFFVSEEGDQITVRFKLPNGKEREQKFDRAKITIIHEVNRKLLATLKKDNPKAYRDYADKLAKEKADPEAMDLALRLYHIAAHLDPANLGRDCLLKMSTLASASPEDARKYRAMAFLIDPKHDESLLKVEVSKIAVATPLAEQKTLTEFQRTLRWYRSGQASFIKAAMKASNDKAMADYFSKAPGKLNPRTFASACEDALCKKCNEGKTPCPVCKGTLKVIDPTFGNQQFCTSCNKKGYRKCTSCDGHGINPYPEDYLKVILRAEVWALDQIPSNEPAGSTGANAGSWSRAVSSEKMPPIPLLRLETITEHDPRKNVFRDGKWLAP